MSDEEESEDCNCPPAGAPLWMATFADLMSLLMCFFVLLLSFSEMDVKKYKAVAGSLKNAFGVQRRIVGKSDPVGSSFMMKQFSPGRPDPTPSIMFTQQTTESIKRVLLVREEGAADVDNEAEKDITSEDTAASITQQELEKLMQEMLLEASEAVSKEFDEDMEEKAKALKDALHKEIAEGVLEVVNDDSRIIVRINERASFAPGSAVPKGSFTPLAQKVVTVLADFPGDIVVSGHSDDSPVKSVRYRSNWELSAARASSVLHLLDETTDVDRSRLRVEGMGATKPLVPNNSPENRAKNRRVEISIIRSNDQLQTIRDIEQAVLNGR